jgi:hypothetical protein
LLIATVGLVVAAGCQKPSQRPTEAASIAAQGFLGSAACAECHAGECRAVAASRHAHTLRGATREGLADVAPPQGAVPLAGYAITNVNGRYEIAKQYPKPEVHPLDYALGSGKTGMTYVSVVAGAKLLEARMSYFPHQHEWEITPGQEISAAGDTPFGRIHDTEASRRCLGCHAVALVPGEARSTPAYYGVGCESCHGAGKAHVDAMRSGKGGTIYMERLGKLTSAKLNDLCGKCHRTLQQIEIDTSMAEETHRFQPFALLRSRCRNEANGPLSCLTCHDPHADASTNRGAYNRICLSCHTAPGLSSHIGATAVAHFRQGRDCPVNATSKCIDCHMRPRKTFVISTFPGTMVDHLISIPRKERTQ